MVRVTAVRAGAVCATVSPGGKSRLVLIVTDDLTVCAVMCPLRGGTTRLLTRSSYADAQSRGSPTVPVHLRAHSAGQVTRGLDRSVIGEICQKASELGIFCGL